MVYCMQPNKIVEQPAGLYLIEFGCMNARSLTRIIPAKRVSFLSVKKNGINPSISYLLLLMCKISVLDDVHFVIL